MSGLRLPQGGLIDRTKPLAFTFDGRPFEGYAGDTIASALLASGVRIFGRSFKYHRPRGLWGAWVDEPSAIMSVRLGHTELPNCLSTTTYLENGMDVRSVNAWPSAQFDVKRSLDFFHHWLGAGFYYKTFIWPDWHLFEPSIRKMAGLGPMAESVLPHFISDQIHELCDTLVIGGGPAGLIAARAAAQAGQDVVLVDDQNLIGGTAYQMSQIEGALPREWVAAQVKALNDAGAKVLSLTTAFGVYDHGLVALAERSTFAKAPRLRRLRTNRIILAAGALDRPAVFPQNDLPGIMSLNAALEYAKRYAVLPSTQAAVMSSHAIADDQTAMLRQLGMTATRFNLKQLEVSARGFSGLRSLRVNSQTIPIQHALVSAGLTPLVHLWRHAGGSLDWCEQRQAFLPGRTSAKMTAIGAANGTYDFPALYDEARQAGLGRSSPRQYASFRVDAIAPNPKAKGRQWVDIQNDVTLKDIQIAAQENFTSVEHLKRYTTLGMAVDQGKTSNMPGLTALAALQNTSPEKVGTTTFRPPYTPVPIAAYKGPLTGPLYHPLKRLPLERLHRHSQAALGEYGGWLRPAWYGPQSPQEAVQQEALQARKTAGIFDASPLGKIHVLGPDSADFVNFIYYNTLSTLEIGRIRYGFMLTEGGTIFDDGVISRIGQNHYLISCSSSHVDAVRTHLETWRQDGHDPRRIFVHDMTASETTLTVTGPSARRIMEGLCPNTEFSENRFPHMSFVQAVTRGVPMRISRVSFTGDLSYEISVSTADGPQLWSMLSEHADRCSAVLIGLEAVSILRAEKGFVMIGKDTDGETMPHDLGFSGPRSRKRTAYVGDRSLQTAAAKSPNRKQLVGLKTSDKPLPTGAHIVAKDPERSLGYVTSSYFSPYLDQSIALALIEAGHQRHGDTLLVRHMNSVQTATVAEPCALDPKGERLHAGR